MSPICLHRLAVGQAATAQCSSIAGYENTMGSRIVDAPADVGVLDQPRVDSPGINGGSCCSLEDLSSPNLYISSEGVAG